MGLCFCKAGGHAKVFDKIDIEGVLEAEYGALRETEEHEDAVCAGGHELQYSKFLKHTTA